MKTSLKANQLAARTVALDYEPDGVLDNEVRIGLIALSTDLPIEKDFWRMVPPDRVGIYTTRIPFANPATHEALAALAPKIPDAVSLMIPTSRLDAVVFGCTSATAVIGAERIAELTRVHRPGIPVTNPASAALTALKALSARRVAMLAPYPPSVTNTTASFLREAGIGLVDVACFDIHYDAEVSGVPPEHYVTSAGRLKLDGADALFISCTATRSASVIDAIEQKIGIPVVTSNQAALWHALALTGWSTPIRGHGRLLAGPFWPGQ